MRLLILGGTAWLGGTIAAIAVGHGHAVTCLARGSGNSPPAGAEFVRADRDAPEAYAAVAQRDWDAVIDVSRQPGQVRGAAAAMAGRARHFTFVSSASVYADHGTPGTAEDAGLLPPLHGDVMDSMEVYGEAKVACEQHVLAHFGRKRSLIVRSGLIAGPGDETGRTGYWPLRFARPAGDDGRVLVPEAPDLATQVVDVRDLAAWIVDATVRGVSGIFNAMGNALPLAEHLAEARGVAGHTGPLVAADQDWLLAHGVQPWMGAKSLPLWLPLPEYAGFSSRSTAAAKAAGLSLRPLRETLADTLAWELERGADRTRAAGLSADEERDLLRARASDAG